MPARVKRRNLLIGLLLATIGTVLVLFDVIYTVFFAITVASVLLPTYDWLRDRGVPRRVASAGMSLAAFLGLVILVLPIGIVLYLRQLQLQQLINTIPDTVELAFLGFSHVVDIAVLSDATTRYVTQTAITLLQQSPVVATKAAVFAIVVYGVLIRRDMLHDAITAPIPRAYHDVVMRLHHRISATLSAIYVTQAATAFATFLIAAPVFFLLGYPYPISLAVLSAIFQFLPVVGPSLVIFALTGLAISAGALVQAATVFVVGIIAIAIFPDIVVRPRIAANRAKMPGPLYFVGFIGGVLTLGPIGLVVGPVMIAVLMELFELATEDGS